MDQKENEELRAEEAAAEEVEEKELFVPSSASKRVFAWILFAIVFLGIVSWLLSIACPDWVESVRAWAKGLLH